MNGKRPQDLVFTLYGEYLQPRQRPVWVGSLIALLRPFGLSESAVRTVLSRMTRKRWLHGRRRGRHSYYELSQRGQTLLREGKARIYNPTWTEEWDGRWFLLSYSIPEDVRHLRDRLRVRLAWLGFGPLGNGVWISPHDVGERVEEMARDMRIREHLICFRARYLARTDDSEIVGRCWDLGSLASRYRAFLRRWQPEGERIRSRLREGTTSDEQCFVLRFSLLHEYRGFPLDDPYLPRALLPDEWPGETAAQVFTEVHDLLAEPAERHVASVLAREPRVAPRSGVGR